MEKKMVSIHIGQLHASKHPTIIYTLLGSCVAVCLFDPETRIGGMNHILMPGTADFRQGHPGRYGNSAIQMLTKRIGNLGGNPDRLVAKVFGGARIFQDISMKYSAGLKNVQNVISCLEDCRVPILNSDLGGGDGRKIYFRTDTGEVFLKRVRPNGLRWGETDLVQSQPLSA
jgi:chemotaxis protein CheD